MKILILFFAVLTLYNCSFSQSVVVHKYGGQNDTVAVADVDSITFLPFICGLSKVKYAGKIYHTVQMGTQCWLKENIDAGTMISGSPGNNGVIEKYCYNNDPNNCMSYGGLYTWDEAMQYVTTEGAQGICPAGWHLPTQAQAQDLISFVNNDGNALKREDQGSGAGQGTNTSGFSWLLSGAKWYYGVDFTGLGVWDQIYIGKIGSCGYSCVYGFQVEAATNVITLAAGTMPSWGLSVRCIKN